jgi:hypothetical protein
MKSTAHSFHIPVMGTSFTIDTPLKVSKYGISSVISLVDDDLIEKMRKHYCKTFDQPYEEITNKADDYRAERIRLYLNLINELVKDNCVNLRYSEFEEGSEINKYFELLPETSQLKQEYNEMISETDNVERYVLQEKLRRRIVEGSIDVNIMTKLDKANYKNKTEELPTEYNDAHAALRGFANSNLASSIILSAGMNPRLYAYMEGFSDFYPDKNGVIKKKIVLKVSDYRSALIQGKYLAKKGLWISEYRIESGLNCGGHAFATEGHLLGPILQEFKNNRESLISTTLEICKSALIEKGLTPPDEAMALAVTVQGGIGNSSEHSFLLDHFDVDATGWGTPFLLVPETTNVDAETLNLLAKAKEDDLFLSEKSPLGVPFNSIRGNSKDKERQLLIAKNRPGSSCPKKFLALNKEFTDTAICTASRQYQDLKIKELETKALKDTDHQSALESIEAKECLCAGLATSSLVINKIKTKTDGTGVSICPGPNMAYFSNEMSLRDMLGHIYGKIDSIASPDRPNMFIKELTMYIDYLKNELGKTILPYNNKKTKYFEAFKQNLLNGVDYYKILFAEMKQESQIVKDTIKAQLSGIESELKRLKIDNHVSA